MRMRHGKTPGGLDIVIGFEDFGDRCEMGTCRKLCMEGYGEMGAGEAKPHFCEIAYFTKQDLNASPLGPEGFMQRVEDSLRRRIDARFEVDPADPRLAEFQDAIDRAVDELWPDKPW